MVLLMGDVVSLNKFRKKQTKDTAEKQAKENRILFGRSKRKKIADALAVEKPKKSLSDKKRKKTDSSKETPKP